MSALFVSCSLEQTPGIPDEPIVKAGKFEFSGSIIPTNDLTKTTITPGEVNYLINWEQGDEIIVTNDRSEKMTFTAESAGAKSIFSTTDSGVDAFFKDATSFSAEYQGQTTGDVTIEAGLAKHIPMASKADATADNHTFEFKCTCAVIAVEIPETATQLQVCNHGSNDAIITLSTKNNVPSDVFYVPVTAESHQYDFKANGAIMPMYQSFTMTEGYIYPFAFGKILSISESGNYTLESYAGTYYVKVRNGIDGTVTVNQPANGDMPSNIKVDGNGYTVSTFNVEAPDCHVELSNGTVAKVNSKTNSSTLVIKSTFRITGVATIAQGNVVVEGKVTNDTDHTTANVTVEEGQQVPNGTIYIPSTNADAKVIVNVAEEGMVNNIINKSQNQDGAITVTVTETAKVDLVKNLASSATQTSVSIQNEGTVVKVVNENTSKAVDLEKSDENQTVTKEGEGTINEKVVKVYIGDTGYATLEAALESAKAYDIIKLSSDLDLTGYTQGAHKLYDFPSDVTLDLGGNTITANNFGVVYQGNNLTIKNGKFEVANSGSYALFVGDESNTTGVVLSDLTCTGGINVYNASVKMKNLTVTGTNFYAVWADEGADITIESGNYSAEGEKASILSDDKGKISITGGTFSTDPSHYVMNGYKANEENSSWTVEKDIEVKGVAKIGDTTYDSLHDALDALTNGDTCELLKDVDLMNEDWEPITKSYATFDGMGHTIKNLKVVVDENDSFKNAGLFASFSCGTIKNLNIVGADVTGINHVSAICGSGLCTKIENCTVKNAALKAIVTNNDDGDKVGAFCGYLSGESVAYVKNCSVENCAITGYRDLGSLVGYANVTAIVSGCSAKNVTITVDNTNNYKSYHSASEYDANELIGEKATAATVANNTFSTITINRPASAVAKIGSTYYNTLKEAFDKATSGDVVKILASEINSIPSLPSGVTLEGVDEKTSVTCEINSNTFHNVTLKNLKFINTVDNEDGGSAIRYGYVNEGESLTIDNCEFDQTGKYAIHFDGDNNGTVYVKGSKIKGTVAVAETVANISFTNCEFAGRCKGTAQTCNINIYKKAEFTDCTFDQVYTSGASRGILMLGDKSSSSVTMTGCSVKAGQGTLAQVFRTDHAQGVGAINPKTDANGKFIADDDARYVTDDSSKLSALCASGTNLEKIGDESSLVYKIVEPTAEVTVSTPEELKAALASTAKTKVILKNNITLKECLSISGGKNIILDLADYTLTKPSSLAHGTAAITVSGNSKLTICGNEVAMIDASLKGSGGGVNRAIFAEGTSHLTIEGGTISGYESAVHVQGQAVFEMKGGKLTGTNGSSSLFIRSNATSTISGGVVCGVYNGGYPTSSDGVNINSVLNITGGTIQHKQLQLYYGNTIVNYGTINISVGTITNSGWYDPYEIASAKALVENYGNAVITGGTFNSTDSTPCVINGSANKTDYDGTTGKTSTSKVAHVGSATISAGTFSTNGTNCLSGNGFTVTGGSFTPAQ